MERGRKEREAWGRMLCRGKGEGSRGLTPLLGKWVSAHHGDYYSFACRPRSPHQLMPLTERHPGSRLLFRASAPVFGFNIVDYGVQFSVTLMALGTAAMMVVVSGGGGALREMWRGVILMAMVAAGMAVVTVAML
ncbi:hypothetical protein E2C01_077002 [Portunus trituberculatus]|uniref:Uncharacterized protein n=1 Tax=Portunus trituberculatus TaxID=210409 RepID=A0A5B7IJ90_PORTR|nr:hypothetical protein [Portunus trituberculatus]